ncbi:hypothetical protein SDC9_142713 [bioreactor metagenome]|uniref:Uncharacterized protein n=1 Tax=bioreactor metagenome TaxID=1076179 RepID=A0A645E2E1_9ZZZZ
MELTLEKKKSAADICVIAAVTFMLSVFINDGAHFVEFLFHVKNKLNLTASAVKVLAGAVYAEIFVPVDIVGKKSGGQLHCNYARSPRHSVYFCRGEEAPAGSDEAFRKCFKIFKIDGNL